MTTLVRHGKAANQAECNRETNPGWDFCVLCIQFGFPFVICLLSILESILKSTLMTQMLWFY